MSKKTPRRPTGQDSALSRIGTMIGLIVSCIAMIIFRALGKDLRIGYQRYLYKTQNHASLRRWCFQLVPEVANRLTGCVGGVISRIVGFK